MKKFFRKCGVVLTICAVVGVGANSVSAAAASKSCRAKDTLRLMEIDSDTGVWLYTVVDVDTTAREYYKLTSGKIEYYKRKVYATFDVITNNTSWEPIINPIRHVDSSGTTTKSFSNWKKEDYVSPDVESVYNRVNNSSVKYNRTSNKKAKWGIGIYGRDASFKMAYIDDSKLTINLNYSYSTGK